MAEGSVDARRVDALTGRNQVRIKGVAARGHPGQSRSKRPLSTLAPENHDRAVAQALRL